VKPVIVLILAAVWMVVLAPTVWKRFSGNHAGASIASFHHELRLLEHSGPKLIAPAFRLETAYSGAASPPSSSGYPAVSSMPGRPSLVLLEPNAELERPGDDLEDWTWASGTAEELRGGSGTVDAGPPRPGGGGRGGPYRPSRPESPRTGGPVRRNSPARATGRHGAGRTEARRAARRRRRNVLVALLGTVFLTGLLGLDRPLRPAWVVTALAGAALVGFVTLAVWAQHVDAGADAASRPADQAPRRPRVPDRKAKNRRVAEVDRWARFEEFYEEVGSSDEELDHWDQAAAY
jgi:hypothetical protein